MIYKLIPKRTKEIKTIIDATTKNAAIYYFAALLHLNKKDLLKIYRVD